MQAGGLEIKKIFEDIIRQNVLTIQDYTKQTRILMRDLEQEVKRLKNMIVMMDKEIAELRQQVSLIQAQLYRGGTE